MEGTWVVSISERKARIFPLTVSKLYGDLTGYVLTLKSSNQIVTQTAFIGITKPVGLKNTRSTVKDAIEIFSSLLKLKLSGTKT